MDEDTGDVVSIGRNEVLLERDSVIATGDIETIIEAGLDTILLHKEDMNEKD